MSTPKRLVCCYTARSSTSITSTGSTPRLADADGAPARELADAPSGWSARPAQLALAWVLARAPHTVAIPGTRSETRLAENAASADLELSDDELDALDAAAPPGVAAGDRYSEAGMRAVHR